MDIATLHRRRAAIDRARESNDTVVHEAAVGRTIAESWRRSRLQARTEATAELSEAEAIDRWLESPVRRHAGAILSQMEDLLGRESFAAAFVDRTGLVLWCSAMPAVARAAERSGFFLGSYWSETSLGTNGPGTAMASGLPVTVFANEHWSAGVHDWVCYAAPVRNRFGSIVGALDISTSWRSESSLALATVTAMSSAVEHVLAAAPLERSVVHLRALGHHSCSLHDEQARLPLRQAEILVLLAMDGEASLDQLHDRLHGERPVSRTTTKAEISALRRLLGTDAITSRPYRLDIDVDLDALHLADATRRGDLVTATRLYRGQLLPNSESPGIIDIRHRLDARLRSALLRSGTADQLGTFARFHPDDIEIAEAAALR